MNEQPTVSPAPPKSTPEATGAAPGRLPHPVTLFAVAATIGILAALAVGFGVGALVVSAGNSDCSPSDGWCELGASLIGALVGAAAGTAAYIAGGVMTIMRCRPAGARTRHVIAHLLFPVTALVFASALGAIVG